MKHEFISDNKNKTVEQELFLVLFFPKKQELFLSSLATAINTRDNFCVKASPKHVKMYSGYQTLDFVP